MWFLMVMVFVQGTVVPADVGAGSFESKMLCEKGIENVREAYKGYDVHGHCFFQIKGPGL